MDAALAEATQQLRADSGLTVLLDAPMAEHTSFGIGGPADVLVIPHSLSAALRALRILHRFALAPVFLGNGTNVLVSDAGVRGIVLKAAGGLTDLSLQGESLTVCSGASLAAICHLAADTGLSGLEFAAGIPGSVGGAVIMNAGAHGGEMAQVLTWVEVATPAGDLLRLTPEEAGFSYRQSALRERGQFVARVGIRLVPAEPAAVHSRMCEIIQERCAKQPVASRSAGCIFKRPPGDYAGRLIEAVAGKGLRVGDAEVSPKHANFVVNRGHARARDVLELIRLVQQKVHDEFGVDLETEICLLGEYNGR